MPKQPKGKSSRLQELEAVFDRHTRRFSPFAILGLSSHDQEKDDALALSGERDSSLPSEGVQPRVEEKETTAQMDPRGHGVPPTHRGVDTTHLHEPPIHMGEGGTSLPGEWIHPRVVEEKGTTPYKDPHDGGVPPTHRG